MICKTLATPNYYLPTAGVGWSLCPSGGILFHPPGCPTHPPLSEPNRGGRFSRRLSTMKQALKVYMVPIADILKRVCWPGREKKRFTILRVILAQGPC